MSVKARRIADTVMRATFGLGLYKHQLRRWPSVVAIALYLLFIALMMWLAVGRPTPYLPWASNQYSSSETYDAATEWARTFSPVLVDILVVAMFAALFLWVLQRSFLRAIASYRIDNIKAARESGRFHAVTASIPDGLAVCGQLDAEAHFSFPAALRCTIESSILNSDALFQSLQGGFDLAKLSLRSVTRKDGQLCLHLGTCAFRDLNLAHYWAFVPIASESSNETDQRQKSLFDLTSVTQHAFAEQIKAVVESGSTNVAPENSIAPNPLGLSVFVQVSMNGQSYWLFRRRTKHVAADTEKYCPAVAGLIDVFPDFATSSNVSLKRLLEQEYHDEVWTLLRKSHQKPFRLSDLQLDPLGLVFDPDANYQPELYMCINVNLDQHEISAPKSLTGEALAQEILTDEHSRRGELRVFDRLDGDLWFRLRRRDRLALKYLMPSDALREKFVWPDSATWMIDQKHSNND